jgi:ATP-dependent DNA helicase PIF1
LAVGDAPILEFNAEDNNIVDDNKTTAVRSLRLRIGDPVILIRNLDRQLFNGLSGVVVDASQSTIMVKFEGVQQTTAIQLMKFDVDRDASRVQFPLMLSFALTIHRAQGLGLKYVEVDLAGVFEYGQAYVALSRAKNIAGLRVLNYSRDVFKCNHVVKLFYEK